VSRTIFHLDMDAFYAAVEQRDRPELRGKPVIIGSDPKGGAGRGVVSTCSYEARRFGVRSAQSISEAWRLCPQGIYVQPDMKRYAAVSEQVMEILGTVTDLVEPVSIDEAFLDVGGSLRPFGGSAEALARALKDRVRERLQLTASVGVASCKLVAKVASDMRKPDGLVIVPAGQEAAFLAPLPVRRLWGVGPKMEERLIPLGLHTIGDLARADPARLERKLGTHGFDLQKLARGEDDRPVVPDRGEAKSLGAEHTFDADVNDADTLRRTLLDIADHVARRLRRHGLQGRTVTLKYRDEDFETLTRAETAPQPTDSGDVIFAVAWRLFQKVHGRKRVRLLGVTLSHFGAVSQLGLFAPAAAEASAAERVRDALAARFGRDAVTRASLLKSPRSRRVGWDDGPAAKDAKK
jgi:nucleotidyltransferase/DNA polymerase involved in DNA repair